MSASHLDLLRLRKMSKGWRAIVWFFGGPAISLFIAYVVCIVLMLVCDRAMNIDTRGTPVQEFLARLVVPVMGLIFFCGSIYSLFKAFKCWREKEEPIQPPGPTRGNGP
jgi:hypothetical protein